MISDLVKSEVEPPTPTSAVPPITQHPNMPVQVLREFTDEETEFVRRQVESEHQNNGESTDVFFYLFPWQNGKIESTRE